MDLIVDKCASMHDFHNSKVIYKCGSADIQIAPSFKDLGIVCSHNNGYAAHLALVASKVRNRICSIIQYLSLPFALVG